ncbi:MAG: SH3 domain-containing protein [Lachnospiraceae bacterium]|nr:SH3 domain-containing protein [Lachnospiraceae bacterium]
MSIAAKKRRAVAFLLTICMFLSLFYTQNNVTAASSGYVNVDVLNVRTGPSTSYARVKVNGVEAYLTQNAKVEILSKSGDWYQVNTTFAGQPISGYVFASYVTVTSSGNGGTGTGTYNAYCNAEGVNIRSGPSTSYSRISVNGTLAYISYKTPVEILSVSNDWYYVRTTFRGTEIKGYMYSGYITRGSVATQAPTQAPTQGVSSGSYNGYCNADGVNIRSGPSTSYSRITVNGTQAYILKNVPVEIISQSGEWYYLRTTFNGTEIYGYMYGSYITRTSSSTPTPVPTQGGGTATGPNGYCNADGVNIRTGPSTNYSRIVVNGVQAYIMKNAKVEIFSKTGDWYYLRTTFNGVSITGYMYAYYINKTGDYVSENPGGGTQVTGVYNAYVSVESVNVRTGPGTNYQRVNVGGQLAYLVYKNQLEIISTTGEWSYVRTTFNGQEIHGYMYSAYLTRVQVTPTPTPLPTATPVPTATPTPEPTATPVPTSTPTPTPNGFNAYVSAGEAYVRTGPGTTYDRVSVNGKQVSLFQNDLVKIVDTQNDWHKIEGTFNGAAFSGYIYAPFVVRTVAPTPTPTPFMLESEVAGTANANVNLRLGPGTAFARVVVDGVEAYVSAGQAVTITGVSGEWYAVKTTFNGTAVSGYCFMDYITPSTQIVLPTPTPTPEPTATPTPVPTEAPTAPPEATATPTPTPDTRLDPSELYEHTAYVCTDTLNLRDKAGTSGSKVLVSMKYGQKVVVIGEDDSLGETWYKVVADVNGTRYVGYVFGLYIYFSLNPPAEAVITAGSSTMHTSNSMKSAAVKDAAGNALTLSRGNFLYLISQLSYDSYWFKAEYSDGTTKYQGFILWSDVDFATPTPTPTPTATNTPTPTATNTPTPEPTNTPTPTLSPTPLYTPTPIPTVTPKVTETPTPTATNTPTPTNTPSPTPTPYVGSATVGNFDIVLTVKTAAGPGGMIVKDADGNAAVLTGGMAIDILSRSEVLGTEWLEISYETGGVTYTGFIDSVYAVTPETEVDFETKLEQQGFPESYKVYLRALHEKYPNWQFKAYHTGLDWNTVIAKENVIGVNLIPNSKSVEWKSLEKGAYNWKTDSFIVYDGSYWVTVSKEGLEYYMDPRNWLSENYIFMFELLKYQSDYQTLEGVEKILRNTVFSNASYNYTDLDGNPGTITYGETIIAAAEYSGVSPYHLASRIKQEVVYSSTTVSDSVSGTFAGYEGLYNFFNIGSYNSTAQGGAIANGLKYAKYGSSNATYNANALIPWTSPYRSIVGGGWILGYNYIVGRDQNTIYLQKFNVTPTATYSHQYMGNVEAPWAEAMKVLAAYGSDAYELPIVFSIPVYENMPEVACAAPAKAYNPNNWLQNLNVTDTAGNHLVLSPTFDMTANQEYAVILDPSCDAVTLGGTTVSAKAKLSGAGTYPLEYGLNRLVLYVTAENGETREYIINVVREGGQ